MDHSLNGWIYIKYIQIYFIFENRDDYKCLFLRKTVPLKILIPCKWLPEIMAVPLKCMTAYVSLKLEYALNRNIFQIHCLYTVPGRKCCSEINSASAKEWMAATNFVK